MNKLTAEQLSDIFKDGENVHIEFKMGKLLPQAIAKVIAAFANTDGGRVIIGYNELHHSTCGYTAEDKNIIERSIEQLDPVPKTSVYELTYDENSVLIVDVEANRRELTFLNGALYTRVGDTVRVMNDVALKSAYSTRSPSPENAVYQEMAKMNTKNDALQREVEKLQKQLEEHNQWSVRDSKSSFRWAIVFCVLGAFLGAILGVLTGKLFP